MRSVPRSVADPLGANASNVTGVLHLLDAAAKQKKKPRVVYASSSSVYGEQPELPKREDQPTAPISPYAATKVAGELYASVWTRLFGVETVGLRYFNVFGPRQDPKSEYAAVIPRSSSGAGRQAAPGPRRRHPVARLHLHRQRRLGQPARRAGGAARRRRQVIQRGLRQSDEPARDHRDARDDARPPLMRKHAPGRMGDVPHTLADVSAAKRDFGYEPLVDFDEGAAAHGRILHGRTA